MLRQIRYSFAAAVVVLAAAATARGQEPKPAPISEASFAEGGATNLVLSWRFHPGDDPRWAAPALDDRNWEPVEPTLWRFGIHPRTGWQGSGWFRRHLQIAPELWGKPLVIRIQTPGATTVFVDGKPLMSVPPLGLRAGGRLTGGAWREVVFSPRRHHVLAVRHRLPLADRHARSRSLGFSLSLEKTDAAAIQAVFDRLRAVLLAVSAVPAFLVLLHLALYLSYPKARENLFYALSMAAFAVVVALDRGLGWITSELWFAVAFRLVIASVVVAIFFFLLTYYAVRTRALPRLWKVFAAVGAVMILGSFLSPELPSPQIWFVYFGLTLIEVVRIEVTGETVQREGVKILLAGTAIMTAVILAQILMYFEVIPLIEIPVPPYLFGLLAVAVAMSLFLARSFGRTSVHLERKTGEIEAARRLQLSMLPAALPEVPDLETAAVMLTASEVGGDYYDFRVEPGSLVVAFGDATGHGVAAGIMVTAVKALFSTLGGGGSLPAVLAECDRVLRGMQVKPLHMCLTLARVTPRSVTLCSAAMPPLLLHRATSGEVEELGSGGPPVGSRLAAAWTEHSVPLAPGDTLLFASDGFAEQLDPDGNPFGYERMAEVFRCASGVPAGELVERLLARMAAWRGESEQGDDVTLVVIRVTR